VVRCRDDLVARHNACPMHALVGGGDQLYNVRAGRPGADTGADRGAGGVAHSSSASTTIIMLGSHASHQQQAYCSGAFQQLWSR
jgi:hypothetical protein